MNSKAPYLCSVKTGNRANGSAIVRTWHVNNLMKFTAFLDSQFPTVWTWFNVYDSDTRKQLAAFTNRKRPESAKLRQCDFNNFKIVSHGNR